MSWYVARDGKQVSPLFDTEPSAFHWLLTHQPFSANWAMKHEGYEIKETS